MRPRDVSFIRELAEQFSALQPMLNEHVEYLEEVLPHLFLADRR